MDGWTATVLVVAILAVTTVANAYINRNKPPAVINNLEKSATTQEHYDDQTLRKVYDAIRKAGVGNDQSREVVSELQNAGILFRERSEKD